MEFQSGTTVEVQSGADICADSISIGGSYLGSGTKCGGILPVELASMIAKAVGRDVVVSWLTVTETNTFGFELQRKPVADANWQSIGFVPGAGTSSSPKDYSFTDRNLASGRYDYRIKQMSKDGSFTYTAGQEVDAAAAPKLLTLSQNYPNPFNPTTTIEFTLARDGHVLLDVYDIEGREIATLVDEEKNAGNYYQVIFDAGRFGSGTYFFRLNAGGLTITRKMVVLK